jgi:hypothetical protein
MTDASEKKSFSFTRIPARSDRLCRKTPPPPGRTMPGSPSVCLNYEEGFESNVLHGDAGSERSLDIMAQPGAPYVDGFAV